MNKINPGFLGICLSLVVLVVSCTKSEEGDNNSTNNNTPSHHLTSYIQFHPSWPVGQDTVWTFKYSYDASKRLTSIVSRYFSSSGILSFTETQNRYFHGTDTLPFKTETQILSTNGNDNRYIHLLYYDANGLIVKDSIEQYNPPYPDHYFFTIYFTKSGNGINATKQLYTTGSSRKADSTFTLENVINGNLASHRDTTTYFFGLPPTVTVENQKFEFYTYDNKHNPFRSTLLPYPFYYYGLSSTSSSGTYNRSFNNPTHSFMKTTSGFTYESTINYTYNSSNYPDSISSYSTSGGQLLAKGKYFYSIL